MKKVLIVVPVYITYDLHIEFTRMTINSIHAARHTNHTYDIMVVSSYCGEQFKEELERMEYDHIRYNETNGVSIAWNIGTRFGVENMYNYITIVNNDIVFHQDAFDNLVAFADTHPEYVLWSGAEWKGKNSVETRREIQRGLSGVTYEHSHDEHPHFSFFMISPQTVTELYEKEKDSKEPFPGYFDENFAPAYFEDGDMHQRILFHKYKAANYAGALFYHYGSRTINIDSDLNARNRQTYERNREYFERKWGFDAHSSVLDNDSPIRFKFKKPFEQ